MIKNAIEFQSAILGLQRQASQPNPSRAVLANSLERLASEVWAAAPKKVPGKRAPKKKAPKELPPPVIRNIGEEERKGLKGLSERLDSAIKLLDREYADYAKRVKDDVEDGYKKKEAEASAIKYVSVVEVTGEIAQGLSSLVGPVMKNEDATEEHELAEVLEKFRDAVERNRDEWVEDADAFEKAKALLTKAQDSVPEALTGPGALAKLQKCLDFIAKAISTYSMDDVKAPKIPNALDPEDPRQLGFGFTASVIKNADDFQLALDMIYGMACEPNPSRQVLADQLLRVASALTQGSHS